MDQDDLTAAMIIGKPPVVSAGLSEFGMGMKTASIWFADQISIQTKKYGVDQEFQITLDLNKYVAGDSDLQKKETAKAQKLHYTILELSKIRRKIGESGARKIKDNLGSIYREYLRKGLIEITFNGEPIEAAFSTADDEFLLRSDGTPYRVELENIEVNGKKVHGWIGILAPGKASRSKAGFAIIRENRAVRGFLDSWRPEEIFGDARNDLINQRITGELFVDGTDFRASHTKDAIDWEDDEEALLGEELEKFCKRYDLVSVARRTNKSMGGEESPESEREKAEAREELKRQLTSDTVIDQIQIIEVPAPQEAKLASKPLIDGAAASAPFLTFQIGPTRMAKLYELSLSVNDPYFEFEVLANEDLKIIVNGNHPAMELLSSAESRLAHYQHVVLEAVAEWKCAQLSSVLEPKSIRLMKDAMFRALSKVENEV